MRFDCISPRSLPFFLLSVQVFSYKCRLALTFIACISLSALILPFMILNIFDTHLVNTPV